MAEKWLKSSICNHRNRSFKNVLRDVVSSWTSKEKSTWKTDHLSCERSEFMIWVWFYFHSKCLLYSYVSQNAFQAWEDPCCFQWSVWRSEGQSLLCLFGFLKPSQSPDLTGRNNRNSCWFTVGRRSQSSSRHETVTVRRVRDDGITSRRNIRCLCDWRRTNARNHVFIHCVVVSVSQTLTTKMKRRTKSA